MPADPFLFLFRQDLCNFAKGSKAVKTLVEKQNKISSRPGSRPGSRPASRPGSRQGSRSSTPVRNEKNMKIDKALAAFKVYYYLFRRI